jgi:hypothetical protein
MQKNLLLIIALFLIKVTSAQYYTFLTFGYNAGLSNSQSVVNNFVNDYNNIHDLKQTMNLQNNIQGFTGSWGWGKEGIFFDLMYTNKYSLHTATYNIPSSTALQAQDVRFTYNTFSLCMYFVNFKHKSFRGPGVSIDFGNINQRIRNGDAGTVETQSYTNVGTNSSLGLTVCYDFKTKIVKGVFLGLRPYYQFIRCDADISSVVTPLNNNLYSGSTTKIKGGNYGLQINIGFGTYHY